MREAGCKRVVHLGHLMGFPSWSRAGGKEGVEWAAGWEKGQAEGESEGVDLGLWSKRERKGVFFPYLFYFSFISKPFQNISKIFEIILNFGQNHSSQ